VNTLDQTIEKKIHRTIIPAVLNGEYKKAQDGMSHVLDELHARIPDSKRISYGIVYTVKLLSEYLYTQLFQARSPVFEIAEGLFSSSEEARCRGVALGMLSFYGLEDYPRVLPYFEAAATAESWDLREFAQMFFRRLIKKHPCQMQAFLLRLADSEDANIRRFIAETLRPVQDNKWFYSDPEYSLSVLRHLFKERSPYPRTSVGNNLSDLARRLPELVYALVAELVANGDKNSYRIAYRACRNLVKQDPLRVMDLLRVDQYRYKEAVYKRADAMTAFNTR